MGTRCAVVSVAGIVRVVFSGRQGSVALGPVVDPAAEPARVPAIETAYLRTAVTALSRSDLRARRGHGRVSARHGFRWPFLRHGQRVPAAGARSRWTIRIPTCSTTIRWAPVQRPHRSSDSSFLPPNPGLIPVSQPHCRVQTHLPKLSCTAAAPQFGQFVAQPSASSSTLVLLTLPPSRRAGGVRR